MSELRGVYLLGLRGSGKTELGGFLAERLGFAFLDSDALITEQTGRSPGQILDEEGEVAFRRFESEVLETVWPELEEGERVLALGGGSPESPAVEHLLMGLRDGGWRGVWLVVDPSVLARRVRRSGIARPRLVGRTLQEEIRLLTSRRAALFGRLADLRFDNSGDDIAAAAGQLAAALGQAPA